MIRDQPRNKKKSTLCNRTVRRVQKQFIKNNNEDELDNIPSPKSIVNDYDVEDYKFDYEYTLKGNQYKEALIKNRRK